MMKKLTGLLAAVVLMASGAAMADTSSVTQTVDASVAATISLSIDAATKSLTLVPGTTTSSPATLTVNASQPYTISAAADTDVTKGTNDDKLFEWSGTAYVASGAFVNASVQVAGAAGTATGTGASAANITTSGIQIFTGDSAVSGGTVTATTSVATPWGTAALPTAGGHTYHMVVTYTATTTSV